MKLNSNMEEEQVVRDNQGDREGTSKGRPPKSKQIAAGMGGSAA